MSIQILPNEILELTFSELPISSIRSAMLTCQKWNSIIAQAAWLWKKMTEKLPLPGRIAQKYLRYIPEWEIYNKAGHEKDKVKHFLLNSRTAYLFIKDEPITNKCDKPFLYERPGGGAGIYYPNHLHTGTVKVQDRRVCVFFPFQPRYAPVLAVEVQDQNGQLIDERFINRVQYFYLLDVKEGEYLYWIFNGIFYRIVCSQHLSPKPLSGKKFEVVVNEYVNNFIEKSLISKAEIEEKKELIAQHHAIIDSFSDKNYDKRWLLIC